MCVNTIWIQVFTILSKFLFPENANHKFQDTDTLEDLNFDALDEVEFEMDIEEEFNIDIPEQDKIYAKTLKDYIDLINKFVVVN